MPMLAKKALARTLSPQPRSYFSVVFLFIWHQEFSLCTASTSLKPSAGMPVFWIPSLSHGLEKEDKFNTVEKFGERKLFRFYVASRATKNQ